MHGHALYNVHGLSVLGLMESVDHLLSKPSVLQHRLVPPLTRSSQGHRQCKGSSPLHQYTHPTALYTPLFLHLCRRSRMSQLCVLHRKLCSLLVASTLSSLDDYLRCILEQMKRRAPLTLTMTNSQRRRRKTSNPELYRRSRLAKETILSLVNSVKSVSIKPFSRSEHCACSLLSHAHATK